MEAEWISAPPGTEILLLGNRAVARGAIEAGVNVAAAYPGTPSSEIMESLLEASKVLGFHAEWSINEKVAVDNVAGAAIIGARGFASMKSAGLSVAADTFFTIPYGGVKGGLVIAVADDPDAHYSSTEHDSRPMAVHAEILCLEPANSNEAKEMTRLAFDLSEDGKLPVMIRLVSRVSHGSSNVVLGPIASSTRKLGFNKHYEVPYRWGVYGPPGTKYKHEWLRQRQPTLERQAEESAFNHLKIVASGASGVIASGLGYSYAWEAIKDLGLEGKVNWLKIGTCYPLPASKVREILEKSSQVLVVEDGNYFVESRVKLLAQEIGCSTPIFGKLGRNRVLPDWGEINTDMVAEALSTGFGLPDRNQVDKARREIKARTRQILAPRSSTLCAGCPHLGSYWGLREVLKKQKAVHILNVDIGCYEQAGYGVFAEGLKGDSSDSKAWSMKSLYETADTCYVMGSSIGMAEGQSQAGYSDGKLIAIAGDSTFYHACLPGLANAVEQNPKTVFMVLDNRWTAMTGHQPSPTSGILGTGDPAQAIDIVRVCHAMGVKNILTADAFDIKSVEDAVKKALASDLFSVLVITGECQIQAVRMGRKSRFKVSLDLEECTGCALCTQLGCPAIGFDSNAKKVTTDTLLCANCGLCTQVCPTGALRKEMA